jgi:hypothetical protein
MTIQFGFDINNPGASAFARGAVQVPQAFFSAIIEDIIINEEHGKYLKYKKDGSNLGEAKVRLVPDDSRKKLKDLKSAYPLDMNIQEFPLVGEQVMVFFAAGTYFYTRKLSIKRKITENTDISIQKQLSAPIRENLTDARELSRLGVPTNNTKTTTNTVSLPKVNIDTRPVRSSEGDLIVQGRFGNAIRVGSSLFTNPRATNPQPNILLTAGFWRTPSQLSTNEITPYSLAYENINKDRSSIWMVSNQEVMFEPITSVKNSPVHLLSSQRKTVTYDGAQIFINSDRVILNSKVNEISLFSNREINLSSIGAITLDTENDIFATSFSDITIKANGSVFIKGNEIALVTKKLTQTVTGDHGISGKRIFIGKYGDTTQPMVLGRDLAAFLTSLVTNVERLTTVVTTLVNATTTLTTTITPTPTKVPTLTGVATTLPTLIPQIASITTQLSALLAGTSPNGARFNSNSNFVSRVNT